MAESPSWTNMFLSIGAIVGHSSIEGHLRMSAGFRVRQRGYRRSVVKAGSAIAAETTSQDQHPTANAQDNTNPESFSSLRSPRAWTFPCSPAPFWAIGLSPSAH